MIREGRAAAVCDRQALHAVEKAAAGREDTPYFGRLCPPAFMPAAAAPVDHGAWPYRHLCEVPCDPPQAPRRLNGIFSHLP
jgi:hypothetical protein